MPHQRLLYTGSIETPLGQMVALADADALYLLAFAASSHYEQQIERLQAAQPFHLSQAPMTAPLTQIQAELDAYFSGARVPFQTPLKLIGTPFQQQIWQAVRMLEYGTTCTYRRLAAMTGHPTAARAVAQANAANRFAIVVPCHRLMGSNGALRGYSGGLHRKSWLLTHEDLMMRATQS